MQDKAHTSENKQGTASPTDTNLTKAGSRNVPPVEVYPLAKFLSDEMQARGWTTEDVALRMGWQTKREFTVDVLTMDLLMSVQEDNLLICDEQFAKLATAFDVSEEFFRNLDATWRRWPDRRVLFAPPESIFGHAFVRREEMNECIRYEHRNGWLAPRFSEPQPTRPAPPPEGGQACSPNVQGWPTYRNRSRLATLVSAMVRSMVDRYRPLVTTSRLARRLRRPLPRRSPGALWLGRPAGNDG